MNAYCIYYIWIVIYTVQLHVLLYGEAEKPKSSEMFTPSKSIPDMLVPLEIVVKLVGGFNPSEK